jgi:lysophospholipase L1-like esterase
MKLCISVFVAFISISSALTGASAAPAGAADSSCAGRLIFCDIADRPGLPRVLLIGDSISIGYTMPVRTLLADTANVHRVPRNGGDTIIGLTNLEQWLQSGKWDVIHVNFGLHDAKLTVAGAPTVALDDYTKNLRTILERLRATGARVIWATTTPVPAHVDNPPRQWASVPAYNEAALKVAREEHVAIDDLYNVVLPQEGQLQRPSDVHYFPAGYAVLAQAVAKSISAELKAK